MLLVVFVSALVFCCVLFCMMRLMLLLRLFPLSYFTRGFAQFVGIPCQMVHICSRTRLVFFLRFTALDLQNCCTLTALV